MKRLTQKDKNGSYLTGDGVYSDQGSPEKFRGEDIERVAAIEDILGDEYDLDKINKIVHCKDCVYMVSKTEFPGECYCKVLAETVPFNGFCHRGKAALKAREQNEQ